jgi:hemerythrin
MPWTPNLSVGVKLIDDEHKLLFEKADKLFEAGKNGHAKEYVGELLDFLKEYTETHFADEEKYMLKIQYPGYPEQKKAHEYFVSQLTQLQNDYKTSGGNLLVILNANHIVSDWLIKHISMLDKKLGEFAKANNKTTV